MRIALIARSIWAYDIKISYATGRGLNCGETKLGIEKVNASG
jgi:hypothetical protein